MIRYGKVNVVNFFQIFSTIFFVDLAAILDFLASEPHFKNICHSSSKIYRHYYYSCHEDRHNEGRVVRVLEHWPSLSSYYSCHEDRHNEGRVVRVLEHWPSLSSYYSCHEDRHNEWRVVRVLEHWLSLSPYYSCHEDRHK